MSLLPALEHSRTELRRVAFSRLKDGGWWCCAVQYMRTPSVGRSVGVSYVRLMQLGLVALNAALKVAEAGKKKIFSEMRWREFNCYVCKKERKTRAGARRRTHLLDICRFMGGSRKRGRIGPTTEPWRSYEQVINVAK